MRAQGLSWVVAALAACLACIGCGASAPSRGGPEAAAPTLEPSAAVTPDPAPPTSPPPPFSIPAEPPTTYRGLRVLGGFERVGPDRELRARFAIVPAARLPVYPTSGRSPEWSRHQGRLVRSRLEPGSVVFQRQGPPAEGLPGGEEVLAEGVLLDGAYVGRLDHVLDQEVHPWAVPLRTKLELGELASHPGLVDGLWPIVADLLPPQLTWSGWTLRARELDGVLRRPPPARGAANLEESLEVFGGRVGGPPREWLRQRLEPDGRIRIRFEKTAVGPWFPSGALGPKERVEFFDRLEALGIWRLVAGGDLEHALHGMDDVWRPGPWSWVTWRRGAWTWKGVLRTEDHPGFLQLLTRLQAEAPAPLPR